MGTWIMAGITFREAARKKILWTAFIAGIGFLFIFGIGLHFQVQDFQTLDAQALHVTVFVPSASLAERLDERVNPVRRLDLALGGGQVEAGLMPAGEEVRQVRC